MATPVQPVRGTNSDGSLPVSIAAGGGGPVTVADGADVAEGATTDAAVVTDAAGTLSSKLRGLVKILADVWDSTLHRLNVSISQKTTLDSGNSSTTPLLANGTFTGTGFDASQGVAFVDVLIESDQSSSATGVQIQFSSDNVNWDDASVYQYTAGGSAPNAGQVFGAGVRSRYYRVVYVNGAVNQTTFRLFTIARPVSPTADVLDNSTLPASHAHGMMVRAAIVGKTTAGGGAFVDVKVNPSGTLTADVSNSTGVATVDAGDVASGSADSGNPVKIGVKAVSALPTALSANQRANVIGDLYGRIHVRSGEQGPAGSYFHLNHNPATNVKATITKTAGAGTVRNVCTGLTVSLSAGATAPAAIQLTVALIDGASGGGTYLWGPVTISLPAVAGAVSAFVIGKCWKVGSQATGMTLEFSAAGGANTFETVDFDCVQIAE